MLGTQPRVEIMDAINVKSTTEDAKRGTEKMLERHPEVNAIATFNEWTSLGVGYAIRELGIGEETAVVAFDSNVVSVGMLETGEVDALIVQNPYAIGYLGVEHAYRLIDEFSRLQRRMWTRRPRSSQRKICTKKRARRYFFRWIDFMKAFFIKNLYKTA